MAGAVSGLHVFAADVGPEPLSLLDNNFSPLTTALNALSNFANYYVDSGSAGAMVITVNSPQTVTYSDGLLLQVKVASTNVTAGCNINVNSLGAKAIVNPDGSTLAIGQARVGAILQLQYSTTLGDFILVGGSGLTIPSSAIGPPASGVALTVDGFAGASIAKFISGSGPTSSTNDVEVDRAGSTANQNGQGPNFIALDTTNSTATMLQNSGGQSELWQLNSGWVQQWRITTAGVMQARDQGGTMQDLGWRDLPQNAQTVNYQLVLADRGKHIFAGGAITTVTIPANASVAFPIGATIVVMNNATGSITLAITTDSLNWFQGGANTTGNRTVAVSSVVTIVKVNTTSWVVTGNGIS